jgi:DNA repair exonuclease SbcCD ATPase subunit
MIQLEAIRVVEFRGIRDLELQFESNSYVIWGPNGSGKSGIVDAIDFVLSGDIARLKGSGSGGLTVLKHGPHVHRRDDPGASRVDLTLRDTGRGPPVVATGRSEWSFLLSGLGFADAWCSFGCCCS